METTHQTLQPIPTGPYWDETPLTGIAAAEAKRDKAHIKAALKDLDGAIRHIPFTEQRRKYILQLLQDALDTAGIRPSELDRNGKRKPTRRVTSVQPLVFETRPRTDRRQLGGTAV